MTAKRAMTADPTGVVDLSGLKASPEEREAAVQEAIKQVLQEVRLLCPCGNNMDEGVELFMVRVIDAREAQPGSAGGSMVQRINLAFCDAECAVLNELLEKAAGQAHTIALRPLLPVEFLDPQRLVQEYGELAAAKAATEASA